MSSTARRFHAPSIAQRRVWHSDPPAVPPVPPTTATPPDVPPKGEVTSGTPPKLITQEAFEHESAERSRRAAESARKKQREALGLEALGLTDEEAKALLAAAKQKQEADKSETQKAQDAQAAAEKKHADVLAELENERRERRLEKRDGEIKSALREAKAKNADKVFAVLLTLKTADVEATLKDDGTVDTAKVKTLIDNAKKDYAEDFAVGGVGSPSLSGGRTPDGTNDKSLKNERLFRL